MHAACVVAHCERTIGTFMKMGSLSSKVSEDGTSKAVDVCLMKEKEKELKQREEELNVREEKVMSMIEGEKKMEKMSMDREYHLRREVMLLRKKVAKF